MAKLAITLLIKNYDHISPLAAGDVQAQDLDLTLDRDTATVIDRFSMDPTNMVGEMSICKHFQRIASGDRSIVGVPIFPTRVLRHRGFYVRRGSDISSLKDLEGKKLGIDQWGASGSTWSRAAMRDQGVKISSIQWTVWSHDGAKPKRPIVGLPDYVKAGTVGRGLVPMLLDGELDGLVGPEPAGLSKADSPIVRVYPDYRTVEREYMVRTGYYPAHHIIGIRRELFDKEPWIARSLFLALEESKQQWFASRRKLNDTTPWLQADMEDASRLIGDDWSPNGVAPNMKMLQHICDELFAQDLIESKLDPATIFTEFEEVMRS